MAFVYHDRESFRPAKRSKKPKRRPQSIHDLVSRATDVVTANKAWLSECRSLIHGCREPGVRYKVMCLGLGSPSELQNARIQLAFLRLVLQNVLDVTDDSVTIFDPAFTPNDVSYLRECAGYIVPSTVPETYTAGPNTVAYMPHCDLSLFETFLKDNWHPDAISNIILVGNNLSDYADNIPSRKLSAVYPCVAKLVPLLETRPVPRSDLLHPAFSSISIQRIRDSVVPPKRHDRFWSVYNQIDDSDRSTEMDNTQISRKADDAITQRERGLGRGGEGTRGD